MWVPLHRAQGLSSAETDAERHVLGRFPVRLCRWLKGFKLEHAQLKSGCECDRSSRVSGWRAPIPHTHL